MFTSSKKAPPPPPTRRSGAPSIVSVGLTVTGNLATEDEVQVDGVVKGDIAAGKVTIGDEARVEGEVVAEQVMIRGEVKGCVRARTVELARSAKVMGDIYHESLSIEAGARVEGVLKHTEFRRETPRPAEVPPFAPADTPKDTEE